MKGETVSEIIIAQEQALQSIMQKDILQTETDSKCRVCQQFHETVEHIISACPLLAKEYYMDIIECVLSYTLTYASK